MDHLVAIGVDDVALDLARHDHIELIGPIADVADMFATNQLPRLRDGGERLDLIAGHTLEEIRAGQTRENVVVVAHRR